jgi:alcohol dehydrogenase class IV
MDALCHCIESLLSVNATEISAAYSYQGVKLLSGNIWRAVQNGEDIEARGKMLLGSLMGGLALTLAGTTAVHALSYPLGKRGVPHGVANGMLLPKVLEYNLPYCEDKLVSLVAYMECERALRGAADVVAYVAEYIDKLPVPKSLDQVRLGEDLIPELTEEALQQERLLTNNPRKLGSKEIQDIYKAILHFK